MSKYYKLIVTLDGNMGLKKIVLNHIQSLLIITNNQKSML